jgi:hypothetical protein
MFVLVVFQIELMDDFLLYSKSVFVILVLLLIIMHLFGDLLLFILVTTIFMCFVTAFVIIDLM